jgi:predicted transcriptional regulator
VGSLPTSGSKLGEKLPKNRSKERIQAIELRKEGWAIKPIAKLLRVSSSSVSLWVRGIPCVLKVNEEDRRKGAGKKVTETKLRQLLVSDFASLSESSKKKRVLLEQEGKCLFCGLSEWKNKPLTLALDHEDGNHQNNDRANLRGLCPNCHSQTETYCGRNRGRSPNTKGEYRVSDERLVAALLDSKTIAEALRKVHLGRQGHHYTRCRALLGVASLDGEALDS